MEDFQIQVEAAPVVFSTLKPPPYNPLRRPAISYKKPIIAAVIYVCVSLLVIVLGGLVLPGKAVWFWLGWSAVYFALIAKRALIWLVHLYQNKASDATRLKCVFEPSCSEYMILAVNKYGFLKGVIKGVRRLLRCHPPNGGVDYP